MPTISGNVTDGGGLPAAGRIIRAYRRDTGALLAEAATSAEVAGDANFSGVSLLLHMNGADGGTVFTDSSSSPKTVTAGGVANTSSAAPKFGSTSAYFSVDSECDYLYVTPNAQMALGTGDFTVEGFIKPDDIDAGMARWVLDMRASSASSIGVQLLQLNAGLMYFSSGQTRINSGAVLTTGWQHIALCRAAGVSRLFVGGAQVGAAWSGDTVNYSATAAWFGCQADAQAPYLGHLDEWRITKGVARYTADFTPPAAAFPDVAGSPGGSYSITNAYAGEVNVVCLDDAAGASFNDLILRTTPA